MRGGTRSRRAVSKMLIVKTRARRLTSLAVRIVPLAAVLTVLETGHVVLASGPKLF